MNVSPDVSLHGAIQFDRVPYEPLKRAVDTLAGVCDGAQMRDDQGFDGGDTRAGHLYAFLPLDAWPLCAFHRAWGWSKKYRRQLEIASIDCSQLVEPPLFARSTRQIALQQDGRGYHVVFPNDDYEVREAFRQLAGSTSHRHALDHQGRLCFWSHTFRGDGRILQKFASEYGFQLGPNVLEHALSPGKVSYDQQSATFSLFFKDRSMNTEVKTIPGHTYSLVGGFHWVIPAHRRAIAPLRAFLTHYGFVVSAEIERCLLAAERDEQV